MDGADSWADTRVLKGGLAGLAGGVLGTMAMTAFQRIWAGIEDDPRRAVDENGNGNGNVNVSSRRRGKMERFAANGEPATEKAANRLFLGFFGSELDDGEKEVYGEALHYGLGTTLGAIYGATAERTPNITRGFGLAFGAGLTALTDEVARPALGLAPRPKEKSLPVHLFELGSHLVYGVVLEATRRGLRRVLR